MNAMQGSMPETLGARPTGMGHLNESGRQGDEPARNSLGIASFDRRRRGGIEVGPQRMIFSEARSA
jgi:hypothetical protein